MCQIKFNKQKKNFLVLIFFMGVPARKKKSSLSSQDLVVGPCLVVCDPLVAILNDFFDVKKTLCYNQINFTN